MRSSAARAKLLQPAQSAKLDEQLPDGCKRLRLDDGFAIELYFGSAHRNGQGEASPGVRISNTPDQPSLPPGYRWFKLRGFQLGAAERLFDKWHLGPLRLLDIAAVAAVLIVAQRWLKPLAVRPLVLMGQSSLQVFCVHLLFCFAGLTLMGNASMLNGWRQFGLLAATFAGMLATATLFSKSEATHERQPKASPGVGTQIIWPPHAKPASRVAAAMLMLKSDSSSATRTHRPDTIS